MFAIKSDLCYGIAGPCWAAIIDGTTVVSVIAHAAHEYYSEFDKSMLAAANRKRHCKAVQRMAASMNRRAFMNHRRESIKKLQALGEVWSGVASCGEFVPDHPVNLKADF